MYHALRLRYHKGQIYLTIVWNIGIFVELSLLHDQMAHVPNLFTIFPTDDTPAKFGDKAADIAVNTRMQFKIQGSTDRWSPSHASKSHAHHTPFFSA